MHLSVVIPLYNESSIINELYERLTQSLGFLTQDYEILFVDDGSTDNTLSLLLNLRKTDKKVKIISLSRNFGHQAAYIAGMRNAKGDCIVTMDGDLQDPPEIILEMYNKLISEKLDIVQAMKRSRSEGLLKRFLFKTFHKIYTNITGYKDVENTGNFAIYNRMSLNALLRIEEKIKYIPGIRQYIGFKQGNILYDRDKRYNGKAKMSLAKLFSLAADALFSSTKFPIRVCLVLGLIGILVFSGVGIYVLIAKIAGFAITGWPSTMLSLLFLGFIQLTFLGVIGEYMFRGYKESQNRPTYFIQDMYDENNEENDNIIVNK